MDDTGALHEAYARFHDTGPEFEGWLSNHGPMAAEAMVRHGHGSAVADWVEGYRDRLEEAPRGVERITVSNWRHALGDPSRLGDWPRWFTEQLAEADWREVLATWWPRLLPGIAAGATHGVIRVGHAVRVLDRDGVDEVRLVELAQALGYWAARWQPVPRQVPTGRLTPAAALEAVPRLPEQNGGINARLERLPELPGWAAAQAAVAPPDTPEAAEAFLRDVVAAAVHDYAARAHGNPVMLVHAATAPNAVLRTLPALPPTMWAEAATTAWTATAAVRAAYLPAEPSPREAEDRDPGELMAAAVRHGDAHLIKLADTVLDVHSWTGDPGTLVAIRRGLDLLDPP